jgi:hypothetical protein
MKTLRLIFAAALIATVSGCQDNPLTERGGPLHNVVQLVNLPDTVNYYLYAYSSDMQVMFKNNSGSKRLDTLPTSYISMAQFIDPDPLDAGTVTLDGTGLTKSSNNIYNNDIPFGLSQPLIWTVSGSSSVPAFTDTVYSPSVKAAILAPAVGADVSKATALTITWTPTADTNDVMALQFTSDVNTTQGVIVESLPDNGSYTITSAQLNQIGLGKATIILLRGNYRLGAASNGKKYFIAAWSQNERDVNIVN